MRAQSGYGLRAAGGRAEQAAGLPLVALLVLLVATAGVNRLAVDIHAAFVSVGSKLATYVS